MAGNTPIVNDPDIFSPGRIFNPEARNSRNAGTSRQPDGRNMVPIGHAIQ
jgi:hypothetical protein